jgi:hypothetical protein
MTTPTQRIRDLETVLAGRATDGPATHSFFAGDLHRAQSGFGGKSAADILDDVEHVNAAIAQYDAIRRQQRLDLVDFAILVSRDWYTDHAQTPAAIDGLITEASWHEDRDRHGEDRAWRNQGTRHSLEQVIEGRRRQPDLIDSLVRTF